MKIFQDLDECILHSEMRIPPQQHLQFTLPNDFSTYYTTIRPCAKALFDFYRETVGAENVYILTTATRDYAEKLNLLGEFGLDSDHIFARQDIKNHCFSGAYGGSGVCQHALADKDNVLIDNLPFKYNPDKTRMMGITRDNYFQTDEYYGVEFAEDTFEADVKAFIANRL